MKRRRRIKAAIQEMIESCESIIDEEHNNSSVVNRDFKLKIRTLQNAPRDVDMLQRLLKIKERHREEARRIEDIQTLVTEIEMLNAVLHLVMLRTKSEIIFSLPLLSIYVVVSEPFRRTDISMQSLEPHFCIP